MNTLIVTSKDLKDAGRWDIDFHLPPGGIKSFPREILAPVIGCADVVRAKRDPTKKPTDTFLYVDIASIDVESGVILRPQELTGEEAPSRARKVIHAYDIIISSCRPTRGAIAVIPEELHGQICSTGFTVIRAKTGHNPYYIHFALRLASTLEQFRKWSTGSSYPAILDEDVLKTRIPLPKAEIQDGIAKVIRYATAERERAIKTANDSWQSSVSGVIASLQESAPVADVQLTELVYTVKEIADRIATLPRVEEDETEDDELEQTLFDPNGE
jgi:type I restriction enzyme S subunit